MLTFDSPVLQATAPADLSGPGMARLLQFDIDINNIQRRHLHSAYKCSQLVENVYYIA